MKKAQAHWLQLMPRKLLMSLTLTPITDRLIQNVIFGGITQQKDAYGETKDNSSEMIAQGIMMLKALMVVAITMYSVHQRRFREEHSNFDDSQAGLTRVIDSMMSKMV